MGLRQRRLILGGNPDAAFPVPDEKTFDSEGEFIIAQGVEKIAEQLIQERKCFDTLREATIRYLWKKKGPESPKLVLGKCQRPAGLLGYYSHADFIVWFSANNCRKVQITNWQMEALVFHELKHAMIEDGVAVSVPHDFEGFAEEIERYGFWKRDIKAIAKAVEQTLHLPFDEPPDPFESRGGKEPPAQSRQVQ